MQPSNYRHIVLESEHPYTPAHVNKWDLSFPEGTQWLVLEFDSRCCTGQAEDRLSLYSDPSLRKKLGGDYTGPAKGDDVTWPTGPLIVPGNTLSAVFQTATDYGNVAEDTKFGFVVSECGDCVLFMRISLVICLSCLQLTVTGHTSVSPSKSPLLRLEVELSYLLGVCLSQSLYPALLKPVAASEAEGEKDADKKGGKKGGKKDKKKKGVSGSGGKWVTLPGAEFDPEWSNGVTLSEDNTKLSAIGSGHALLNYGISRGRIAFEVPLWNFMQTPSTPLYFPRAYLSCARCR